jgi:adenylosuccinate synthase
LDIDHGTYPFVTSSNTSISSVLSGLGIGFQAIDKVIGVAKVFQTRVGSGPFPTELKGEIANRLRGSGENPWDEFGTTTGRPRRVGWFDGVLLRFTTAINGFTELVLTKLDILSGLDKISICTKYKIDGQFYDLPIFGLEATQMDKYAPVYEEHAGWQEDIQNIKYFNDLPSSARSYINKLEEISGLTIKMISVGPEREQIIIRS